MGGTGERNEPTGQENGELPVISQVGENEDEEKQWKRKR